MVAKRAAWKAVKMVDEMDSLWVVLKVASMVEKATRMVD